MARLIAQAHHFNVGSADRNVIAQRRFGKWSSSERSKGKLGAVFGKPKRDQEKS
jgi:hypothetical protein